MRGAFGVADAAGCAQRDALAHATGHSARGAFSLVELIVALTILSIGLLALTGAAAVAQRSFNSAQALEEGVDVAAVVLDSLMREPIPAAGERTVGRTKAQWSVRTDSVAVSIHLTATVATGAHERQLAFTATHHVR